MKKTYRLPKRQRDNALGFAGLTLVLLAMLVVAAIFTGERASNWAAWAFLLACFLGLFLLSVWLLIVYRRARLIISDDRITVIRPWRRKTIEMADVVSARWDVYQRRLVLRTPTERTRVNFQEYDQPAVRELVRYFRESLPEEAQQDWGFFYERIVVRWGKDRTPREGDVLITRRRYDRWAIWTFVALVPVAIAFALAFRSTGRWYAWIALPFLALFWVTIRYSTPREGHIERRTLPTKSGWAFVAALASLLVLPLAALWWPEFMMRHNEAILAVLTCWALGTAAIVLTFLYREEQRRRRKANLAAKDLPRVPPELLDQTPA